MPRRTSREPRAASRPQPHPDCGRLSFAENRAPACEKARGGHPAARESGLLPAEGHPGRSLRSVRRRAFREYRAAAGGCRPARRPDAALPRLERQTTAGCIPAPEAATLRRTSSHRLSARTVPRRRVRSPPKPDSSPPAAAAALPRTVLPDFSSGNPSFCTPRRRIEPIYFGIRNFSLYLHVERVIRFE